MGGYYKRGVGGEGREFQTSKLDEGVSGDAGKPNLSADVT